MCSNLLNPDVTDLQGLACPCSFIGPAVPSGSLREPEKTHWQERLLLTPISCAMYSPEKDNPLVNLCPLKSNKMGHH